MLLSTIKNIVCRPTQKLRTVALSFCVFLVSFSEAQVNLIPNPSFEDTIQIPKLNNELNKCKDWFNPSFTTPDYFSAFSPTPIGGCGVTIPKNVVGFQYPKHGNFYVGGFMFYNFVGNLYPERSWNELVSVKLIQPLKKKYLYNFKLFYSLANESNTASNQLGAYFTQNQFTIPSWTFYNNLIPQVRLDTNTYMTDTLNWVPMQGKFFAQGGEQYVTIGNFKDALYTKTITLNSNSSNTCIAITTTYFNCYVYLDSISLYEIPILAANCANDTTICIGDSVQLGNNPIDTARYSWQPTAGLSCTNCANPKAKPLVNTTYYLTKQIFGTISYDTLTVNVMTLPMAYAGVSDTICPGQSSKIGTDSINFYTYTWKPPIAISCTNCPRPIVSPAATTTYTLTKTGCGTYTADVTITILSDYLQPKISLTNQVHCLTDTLKFTLLNYPTGPNIYYQWQPLNLILTTPTISATALLQNNSYYYALVASGPNSIYCPSVKKDSIFISIPDTCNTEFVIPNIFTPNYDDVNDVWRVKLPYSKTFKGLYIYNRWGTPVYILDSNSKIKNIFWDGRITSGIECGDGVYYYVLEIIDTEKNNMIYRGMITLLH